MYESTIISKMYRNKKKWVRCHRLTGFMFSYTVVVRISLLQKRLFVSESHDVHNIIEVLRNPRNVIFCQKSFYTLFLTSKIIFVSLLYLLFISFFLC